jgi:transcriptional regulator with XRE-family HTH domain
LLAVARENVARLRIKRNLRWKEIAKRADLSEDVLNNLSRGRPVSDLVLARVAEVLGTDLEHLFYNTPDEPETAQPQGEGDWQGAIREVERYVRSITDPERRAAVALRLRAVALGEVEEFERDLNRRASPGGHPGGAPGKSKQGGGRAQGAA